jgi:hypothetical protein
LTTFTRPADISWKTDLPTISFLIYYHLGASTQSINDQKLML